MGSPLPPPPATAAQEYQAAGVSPEQYAAFQAFQNAQSPAEQARAASAAGLTKNAGELYSGQLAAGVQPGPVQAPSFEEQLAEYQAKNAQLETQLSQANTSIMAQIAALQQQLAGVQASVPQKVDPVTETAAKVVQAFRDVASSDAKNIMASALKSHLTYLNLSALADLF
jgi:hypothetical protein